MNERIQELKIQACKWASENAPMSEYENACDEKFAELIVQDCVAEVAMMGVTNHENEDISWACRVIIDGIKSKFGV